MTEQHEGPYPRNPRPGSRTFTVSIGSYGAIKLTRVDLNVLDVIEAELDDYRAGLKRSDDPKAYTAGEDDRAVWEGPRLMAVILPRAGGEPEVYRFDEGQPRPATDAERQAWSIVGELGADGAIDRLTRPEPSPPPPPPEPLTPAQDLAMSAIRVVGEREALDRLGMGGAYQIIRDVVGRLGTDAVGELRRVAAVGERDRGVIARAAEVLGGIDLAGLEGVAGQLRAFNDREADQVVRTWKAIDSARAILAEAG